MLFASAATPPAGEQPVAPGDTRRTRFVDVDRQRVAALFVEDPDTAAVTVRGATVRDQRVEVAARGVTVELFDGSEVSLDPIEASVSAKTGGVEWVGASRSGRDVLVSAAFTLVRDRDAGFTMHGFVSDGEHSYRVQPVDGDVHAIHEMEPDLDTEDEGEGGAPEAPRVVEALDEIPPSGDAGTGIDVLVAYTTSTPSTYVSMIPQVIAETNSAFATSGLAQRVNLVGTQAVSYTQHATDMSEDLNKLRTSGDGIMDGLHALRDDLAADLVALIVPNATNACGIGWIPVTSGSPEYAFSVTAGACFGSLSFTHELGHNLGGDHNPEDAGGACNPYSYSCGHWVSGVARSVMSYPGTCGCTRTLQFSNPSISFIGHPGTPSGTSTRNNALSLDNLAPEVSAYRELIATTPGVFRPSDDRFYLNNGFDTTSDIQSDYGAAGDIPIAGDWDGDGEVTIGVFRPSNDTFYLNNGFDTTSEITSGYGATGDIPIAGDWDGDGDDTIGVFRPSNDTFYLNNGFDTTSEITSGYGGAGDIPIAGDWDGDGDDTIGVFRPSDDKFYLNNSFDTTSEIQSGFGTTDDRPVVGDWDGDGDVTLGVFRPSNDRFYLNNGFDTTSEIQSDYGAANDIPIAGDWDGT